MSLTRRVEALERTAGVGNELSLLSDDELDALADELMEREGLRGEYGPAKDLSLVQMNELIKKLNNEVPE